MRQAAAALLLLTAACRFASELPAGVVVTCAADGICPQGYACQQGTGTCVEVPKLDGVAPAISAGSVRVTYLPGHANPVAQPQALSQSSTARIAFSTTEALKRLPTLASDVALDCSSVSTSDVAFEYGCTVPAGAAPAELIAHLTARLEDLAANVATVPLADVAIDTIPPAPPDTQSARAIVYRREPWGSQASAGLPRYTLTGARGSAPGASFVLTRSGTLDRGRVDVDSDGGFGPAHLQPIDLAELELAAVDLAGNTSGYAPIHDEEWVATAGGKRPYSQIENPNRLLSVRAFGDGLERDDAIEHGAADGLGLVDRVGVRVAGTSSWRNVAFTQPLPLLYPPPFAFDQSRAKWVGFGGTINEDYPDFVLEWSGSKWIKVYPVDPEGDGSPTGRVFTAIAWDERSGRLLIYGGLLSLTTLGDLWEWNGHSFVRQADPPVRRSSAVLWSDRRRNQLIIHGGFDENGTEQSDTWVRRNGTWQALDAGGPGGRALGLSIWDDQSGSGFVGGGRHFDGGSLRDLWRFDGERWVRLPFDLPGDPNFSLGAIDERRRRLVFWQGLQATGGYIAAIDELDENFQWQRVPIVPDAGPGIGFTAQGVGYDPARGVIVIQGYTPAFVEQTWTWDGTVFSLRAFDSPAQPAQLPCELVCIANNPDCITEALTAYGLETYVLNDQGWRASGVLAPTLGSVASFTVDPPTTSLVLATGPGDGGRPIEIYRWIIGDTQWRSLGLSPIVAHSPLVASTPTLFGAFISGGNAGPTWFLQPDGGFRPGPVLIDDTFAPSATTLPDQRVALSGLSNRFGVDVVWLQSGGNFLPLASLPPAVGRALAFDPIQNKLVLYGGFGFGFTATDRAYEVGLDGGVAEVIPADPERDGNPSARFARAFAWRDTTHSMVLAGGLSDRVTFTASTDVWQLERESNRPAVIYRVPLAAVRSPGNAVLNVMRARVVAGGRGANASGAVDGVSLMHWGLGTWRERLVSVASLDAPGDLAFELSNRADLYGLIDGRTEIAIAVTTIGTNGPGLAELMVDYVELELAWRQ